MRESHRFVIGDPLKDFPEPALSSLPSQRLHQFTRSEMHLQKGAVDRRLLRAEEGLVGACYEPQFVICPELLPAHEIQRNDPFMDR
jgi:hypothetical protein